MRKLRAIIVSHVISLLICGFAAMPSVTDVVAKQRYPWNGLVDITCKVTGINGTTNGLKFAVAAVMPDSGVVHNVWSSKFWLVDEYWEDELHVHTNGNYHLLWDASADLGQVAYDNMVMRVKVVDHDMVQLWADGPYWAESNIGAECPYGYGYYFWWGDTVGYKLSGYNYESSTYWPGYCWMASGRTSSDFSFDAGNAPTCYKQIATLKSEGWITADGVLASEHDAAHVHWGGNWRMPTYQELSDLNSKCDWTWATMHDVNGYVVKGKGAYATASIFLPCGAGYAENDHLVNCDHGYYWSSVPNSHDDNSAYLLFLGPRDHQTTGSVFGRRYQGLSVRPVQGFTGYAGDSAPFRLNTTSWVTGSFPISWDASWIGGDSNATVVIKDNGMEVKRTTVAGEFTYVPTGATRHELTYTTLIDGVAKDEVYSTIVFNGDWKYDVVDGGAIISDSTQKSGSITIPGEIDGYPVTGLGGTTFAGCTGLTAVSLPGNILSEGRTVMLNGWKFLSKDSDGTEEYQSASITHNGSTSMSLSLAGPYDLTFSWKVSSDWDDYLSWYLDGTWKREISGTGWTWVKVSVSVPAGKHTISWTYSKDAKYSDGSDCGWVRVKSPTGCSTMSELFPDSYALLQSVTLTGTTTKIPDNAFEGCAALEAIEIPSTVTNIGAYAFAGCCSLSLVVLPARFKGNLPGNVFEGCSVDMQVEYLEPEYMESGYFAVPLYANDGGKHKYVVVPTAWIDEHPTIAAAADGDMVSALRAMAANGRLSVAECYVLGLDPTNPLDDFRIASLPMKADGTPDLANIEYDPPKTQWNVPDAPVALKGAATLEGPWRTLKEESEGGSPETARPTMRFFKAVVFGGVDDDLGGVQLWVNGPYWAECNVGATKPEEYGYYFWWGDTVGYTPSGGTWNDYGYGDGSGRYSGVTWVSSTGQQMSSNPIDTCPTIGKNNSELLSAGYIDSTGNLVAAHDAATAHLGAPWRMPTSDEIQALVNNCTTTWITTNGVSGRLVTGKGAYANRSIFLPAAGYGYGYDSGLYYPGSGGDFWSSTPYSGSSNYAWSLNFGSSYFGRYFNNNRYNGRSVRPVRGFAE